MKAYYRDRIMIKEGTFWRGAEYQDKWIEVTVLGKGTAWTGVYGGGCIVYLIQLPDGSKKEAWDTDLRLSLGGK